MALSGSIKTNSYSGRYYTLSWTATQSIANNASTISWTISCAGGSASWYAERTLKAVINGETVYSKTNRVERKAGDITSGTLTIPHNIDGSKSFSMSIEVACYTSSVNLTKSGSFTLDNIPRAATITAAPNFNDEQNPTIQYSNPAGNAVDSLAVCISFDKVADNIAYRSISKTGNSYTFNLTTAERNVLRNGTTTANSRTVYFYLKTTIGGENYYSSSARTLTIINAEPTINPTVYDSELIEYGTEANWYNPTGDTNTYFIKGWSDATYTINASAKKGATIVSQKLVCGSKNSTTASGTIANVDSATFVFSATDSRGNTVSKTITKTLINYFKPTMNLEVSPPTAQGELEIKFSGKFFNGKLGETPNKWLLFNIHIVEDGTILEEYDIKDSLTINGNEYSYSITVPNLNYKATYNIMATGLDSLYSSAKAEQTVKLLPVFDWGKDDFQFNVPVSMNVEDKTYSLLGLFKALSTAYNCSVSVSPASGYSNVSGSATICGNILRCNISATRSAAFSGDGANEQIATFTINHGGKIAGMLNVSFPNGSTGAVASLYTSNVSQTANSLSFTVHIAATAGSTTGINSFFSVPITLNLDAF